MTHASLFSGIGGLAVFKQRRLFNILGKGCMPGRFMIDGEWCDVPQGERLEDWLNETVAVIPDWNTLEVTGRVRRIDLIERIRKSGRGQGVSKERVMTKKRNESNSYIFRRKG